MRRSFKSNAACIMAIVLGLSFAVGSLAQEPAKPAEAEQHDSLLWWKWANFAILAVGLGYLIRKHAPPLFAQRAREIQDGIAGAQKQKSDAEAQAQAIEERLAALQSEIDDLRSSARAQMAAEADRIQRETEQRLKRIQEQAQQEITLMARGARAGLRRYSAQLALELAERRIRSRVTKDAQDGLVDAFIQDLRHRPAPGARA